MSETGLRTPFPAPPTPRKGRGRTRSHPLMWPVFLIAGRPATYSLGIRPVAGGRSSRPRHGAPARTPRRTPLGVKLTEVPARRPVSQATPSTSGLGLAPGWREATFPARDRRRRRACVRACGRERAGRRPAVPGAFLRASSRAYLRAALGEVAPGWPRLGLREASRGGRAAQHRFPRAAELEADLELRRAGALAAGERLLRAQAPAENEPAAALAGSRPGRGAGRGLRWFITAILFASFLGLVRAGAGQASSV